METTETNWLPLFFGGGKCVVDFLLITIKHRFVSENFNNETRDVKKEKKL